MAGNAVGPTRDRRDTSREIASDMRISMITAIGTTIPNMGTFGIRAVLKPDGYRIAWATGYGSIHGATPGLIANRGVMRRFITDVGPSSAAAGAGFLAR